MTANPGLLCVEIDNYGYRLLHKSTYTNTQKMSGLSTPPTLCILTFVPCRPLFHHITPHTPYAPKYTHLPSSLDHTPTHPPISRRPPSLGKRHKTCAQHLSPAKLDMLAWLLDPTDGPLTQPSVQLTATIKTG